VAAIYRARGTRLGAQAEDGRRRCSTCEPRRLDGLWRAAAGPVEMRVGLRARPVREG
jgi:hypothetical protein